MERIGYFGGTFDPIHNGHLAVAEAVKNYFNLTCVVFIPSGNSYMKSGVADENHRLNMVREATRNCLSWAKYCAYEIDCKTGPSYTIKTIEAAANSNEEQFWIFGADAFAQIEKWYRWEDILNKARNIVVVGRAGHYVTNKIIDYNNKYKSHIYYLDFNYPLSSTVIRENIKRGNPFRFYVPERVYNYINEYHLYQDKFDANAATEYIVEWIRNKMNGFNKDSKTVIGISGGKDSTVMAALCVKALGKDRVVGVRLPNGVQSDIDDARRVCDILDIESYEMNIEKTYYHTIYDIERYVPINMPVACRINIAPRLRMTYLYAVAQTIGNAFVINTCNLSEDWVGYSTWHGDSAGDFSPLAKYTSEEVVAIGDALGLPYDLTHKTPADGLCGKTDEDNLGFTYHELNEYIRGRAEPRPEIKELIDKKHQANLFKLQPLDTCPYYKGEEK